MTAQDKKSAPATIYCDELAETICLRIVEGESLRKICDDKDMPNKATVFRWLGDDSHPGFREQYQFAMEMRADYFAEELIEIADDSRNDLTQDENGKVTVDHEVVARARLRCDIRKWLMARMAPKKYGDKLQHTGDGGGPIRVRPDLSRLTDKELQTLETILGRTADAR